MGDQLYTDIDGKPINPANKIYTDFDGKPINSAQADQRGGMLNLRDPKAVAPVAGRAVAASLPAVGGVVGSLVGGGLDPISAGAGAALGSTVSAALRNEFPQLFGNLDKDPVNFAKNIASDTLTNGVVPEGLAYGMAKTSLPKILTNRLLQKASPSLAEGVQNARVADLVKEGSDLGGKELGENINTRSILSKGMKNGKITNPQAIMDEMGLPDYHFTISPETRAAITEVAQKAKAGDSGEHVLNYVKGRLILGAAGTLAGAATGHALGGVIGGSGLVLTDAMLGHLMADPERASLVLKAMRTPSSAPEASLLNKILTNSVRAAEVPAQVKPE